MSARRRGDLRATFLRLELGITRPDGWFLFEAEGDSQLYAVSPDELEMTRAAGLWPHDIDALEAHRAAVPEPPADSPDPEAEERYKALPQILEEIKARRMAAATKR